jgi:hypothetical protein
MNMVETAFGWPQIEGGYLNKSASARIIIFTIITICWVGEDKNGYC